MSAIRRPSRRPRRPAAWADPAFFKVKQESRDRVAKAIRKYFGDSAAPTVFLLPSYNAFCGKTINNAVPKAVFYGTDYYRSVVQKTDAVDDRGKTIQMQTKPVARYILDNAGSLEFDAAFLDYKTDYTSTRQEIKEFTTKMLKPKAVLAITVQRDVSSLAKVVQADLAKVAGTVVLEDSLEYDTTNRMISLIFLIER